MADPFFKDLAFAALAQTARNPTRDFLQATPRNPILGYLSDLAASTYSPERTQQMQGVAKFMSAPAISETLDRLSYGEPLTTGAGGLGGTTRVRPEALEAAMAVAPTVGPAGRAAGATAMAAGRAGERLAERSIPQIMQRGGMGSEMLQGMSRGTVSPLDVYHGTPYKFDRFDASKIGTGEGAQSYGYGLYFAENPAVSESYQKMISTGKQLDPLSKQAKKFVKENMIGGADNDAILKAAAASKNQAARWDLEDVKRGIPASRNDYVSAMDEVQEFLRKNPIAPNDGSLYKVDLPDEQIAKMLDWDKPLSDQPNIMEALTPENMGLTLRQPVDGGFMAYVGSNGKPIGLQVKGATPETFRQKWIDRLTEFGNAEGGAGRAVGYLGGTSTSGELAPVVSGALRQAGIPGIKYLDEGSRAAGTGTRNFVVFPGNENMLTILERNNQPVQQAMQEFEQSLINFMATPAK